MKNNVLKIEMDSLFLLGFTVFTVDLSLFDTVFNVFLIFNCHIDGEF